MMQQVDTKSVGVLMFEVRGWLDLSVLLQEIVKTQGFNKLFRVWVFDALIQGHLKFLRDNIEPNL
jgi:hypothetical protein